MSLEDRVALILIRKFAQDIERNQNAHGDDINKAMRIRLELDGIRNRREIDRRLVEFQGTMQ